MAKKKEKLGIDKIVERLNKEFEKTSGHFDRLIKDAVKQFDHLNNQVQEPVKKILEDMDKVREREIKRFQDEFDRRVSEFNDLQRSIFEKLGISSKAAEVSEEKVKPAPAKADTVKKAEAAPKAKAAPKKPKTETAAKPQKAASAKPAAAKKAAAPKAAKEPALTKLTGVGPVLAKKMNEAGIKSIKQIASPSDADKEMLKQFEKTKGYEAWQAEAQSLIG